MAHKWVRFTAVDNPWSRETAPGWRADTGWTILLRPPLYTAGVAQEGSTRGVGRALHYSYFVVYDDGHLGWDWPERVPQYVIEKAKQLTSQVTSGGLGGSMAKKRAPKKSVLATALPNVQLFFDIAFEEDNVEEDLANEDEPERREYAQNFMKKFEEGAGWANIENEEMVTLSKTLGFRCVADDSESGQVRGVETVGDVLKLYNAVLRAHGGGDDHIYLDQYLTVGMFMLFPEGVNGPRYVVSCATTYGPCWDDFFEERGIEV